MPANRPPDVRRGKVPHALFWGGMGLAPLAVLILLFGQSTGSLRIAVVLAVLTIVMLALSIALRPSVEMFRVDIEHRVLDELERIRLAAREDTATAARNTHKALTEKIYGLSETVEELRAQVDEVQASSLLAIEQHAPAAVGPGVPGGPGRGRTETVHVTRRTTTVNDDSTGTVYGSRAAHDSGRALDGEWRADDRGERRDDRWDGMAQGSRWAEVRYDDRGRELHLGERRSTVHHDDRGGEYRVEDRWAALRRDDADDRGWSGGRSEPRALPPAPGEPPSRYAADDRHERDRHERDRHDWDRHERDRYDADRHERDRYGRDREREYDRGPERGYEADRGYDRERRHDREPDRDYDRGRGYDRDRDHGHERHDRYDREHDREHDRERGYGRDRPPLPRPRSSEW